MNETVLKQQYLKCYQIFLSFTIYHILIGLKNLSTSVMTVDLYLYWSIIFPAVSLLTLRTIFDSSLCVLNVYSLADHDSFFIIFLIDYPSPFPLFLAISQLCLLMSLFNSSLSPFPSVRSVHHCQIILQTREPLHYSEKLWLNVCYSSLDSPAWYWRLFTFWFDILPLNYVTLISCVNVLLQSGQSLFMSQRYFGPFLTSFILLPSRMPVWILSIL